MTQKGEIAGKEPIQVELEEGKSYWWCACGKSKNQPFCDGSHQGGEFTPVEYVAKRSGPAFFCTCKQTDRAPLCDGTHNGL